MHRQVCAAPARREINFSVPVYMNNISGSASNYSFGLSALYELNILPSMIASAEFTKMASLYQIFKFTGVRLRITPSFINTSLIATLPELFIDCVPDLTTVSSLVAVQSDNATVINLRSTANAGKEVTYHLPPVLAGISGYIVGGTGVNLYTNSYVATPTLSLVLGSAVAPTLVTSTTVTYQVATIDVYCLCEFSAPSQA